MKKLLTPALACILLAALFFWRDAKAQTNQPARSELAEIVKALNIQNRQLDRIADSLERISGQQPGGKVPVQQMK